MFAQGGLNKIVDLQCFPQRPNFTVFYFLSLDDLEKFLIIVGAVIPWFLALWFFLWSVKDNGGNSVYGRYCDNTIRQYGETTSENSDEKYPRTLI